MPSPRAPARLHAQALLYAQAIAERRLTAASLLHDSPAHLQTASGLYIPQNYDLGFKGWVSVRSALASSLNVPAVRTWSWCRRAPFTGSQLGRAAAGRRLLRRQPGAGQRRSHPAADQRLPRAGQRRALLRGRAALDGGPARGLPRRARPPRRLHCRRHPG
jgi:hypothetical protein